MLKKPFSVLMLLILVLSSPVFCRDSDDDGIPNKYDECPKEAEDMDGFEDTDGCPDLDNDKDGVPDLKDKCPNVAEDKDGFEDSDGCPDPDNDKDGIPDNRDKCPMQPEDFDAFDDTDGCPDPDNDKDGILDVKDKCPNTPEDKDGFEDENGCPDYDNDGDGIKDVVDRCPNEAETFNGDKDDDGCPDVGVPPIKQLTLLPMVNFRTGTIEFTFESFRSLDSLGLQLLSYPDAVVRVMHFQVFTGKIEDSIDLQGRQYQAILDYLITKGARPEQFQPVDYSMERYEQVKETPEDFNQNQPIEVHLVE